MRATRPRAAKTVASAKPVVVRIHETTGVAKGGWDAALKAAVKSARADVDEPIAVEITRQWADLSPRGLTSYHVSVKVAYRQAIAAPKPERKKKPAR
ncbi:MAG: dodecin domain-containing protein [Chloroflexota bacterium]|nr:dodecin domain-containing protein [Chloroflexota bacterium]